MCPTLCDPMDWSLPGFSVHGIFQARILEYNCHFLLQDIFPTQGSNPCLLSPALQADSLLSELPGKPQYYQRSAKIINFLSRPLSRAPLVHLTSSALIWFNFSSHMSPFYNLVGIGAGGSTVKNGSQRWLHIGITWTAPGSSNTD